jgi:predicted RNase H-like HicB family nuclease
MKNLGIDEIIQLPYTIEVVHEQGENYSGWFTRVVEWLGCMTQADTFTELGEMNNADRVLRT